MSQESAPGSAGTLLIVDDDTALVELLRRMVERQGFVAVTATNAADALQAFQDNAARIDLIITDLVMSGTDGRAFAQQLLNVKPDVRILVSTGFHDNEDITSLLALGVKGVVYKPYNSSQLMAKVREALAS